MTPTPEQALEALEKLAGVDFAPSDAVATLRQFIEQAPPRWRPIEEAPKDGTFILLLTTTHIRPQPTPFTGRWLHGVPGCWVLVNADLAIQRIAPTHWQPLPAPPSTAKEDEHGEQHG